MSGQGKKRGPYGARKMNSPTSSGIIDHGTVMNKLRKIVSDRTSNVQMPGDETLKVYILYVGGVLILIEIIHFRRLS